MFEKEAIRHAFEDTIGVECLNKPVEDFTYEELSDELQEKAYDFQQGAEFGYNKANEEFKICEQNAEPTEEKIYATPEAYKAEHQEEQNKHIKESVRDAVKGLEEMAKEF